MLKRAVIAVLAASLLASPALAQDLDEVLGNYYEAVGGLDAWKAVQSTRMTGTRMMGMGIETPFTMVQKRPAKIRVEFTVQGMTGIMAFDGETPWMLMPFMGSTDPEVMPEDFAKQITDQADIDGPLVGYQEDGHQVELVGLEETEGTQAYKLKLTLKGGDVQYWFLDSEYYVPIKIEGVVSMQGREAKYSSILSDYKEVEGLMMPHSVSTTAEGAPASDVITVEQVEINVDVDDSVFKMPEKEQGGQQ